MSASRSEIPAMSASSALLEVVKEQDIRFICSVPDKWTAPLMALIDAEPDVRHVAATIEREGLGLAVGAFLAGVRSGLLMQNSGIGNLLNDWASLTLNYQIPIPWIVSLRGGDGERVAAQRAWNGVLAEILGAAGIVSDTIKDLSELDRVEPLIDVGYRNNKCVAALFPHSFWCDDLVDWSPVRRGGPGGMLGTQGHGLRTGPADRLQWNRFEALELIMPAVEDAFVFVNIGDPSKEVFQIRDRPENFYMLGSMGLLTPIGVGFSRAYGDRGGKRKTIVLDGDGSQMMNLGALGTAAYQGADVAVIVIDNGCYGSTGDQSTLTRDTVDLEVVARGLGIQDVITCDTDTSLIERLRVVLRAKGPSLTRVRVLPGAPETPLVDLVPEDIKLRFMSVVREDLETPF